MDIIQVLSQEFVMYVQKIAKIVYNNILFIKMLGNGKSSHIINIEVIYSLGFITIVIIALLQITKCMIKYVLNVKVKML